MKLVGAVDRPRARHGDGVVVAGAAFGGGEIVPAVALEEVRPLDEPVRQAASLAPLDRILVETDAPYLAPVPHRGPSWDARNSRRTPAPSRAADSDTA